MTIRRTLGARRVRQTSRTSFATTVDMGSQVTTAVSGAFTDQEME